MTGGPNAVITNGKFDLAKWKVQDGPAQYVGHQERPWPTGWPTGRSSANKLIDEPENPKWGGVPTKSMIDQMATYAKRIFPTLPMGIGHAASGFKWRCGERYRVLDWVVVQYVVRYNDGDVAALAGARCSTSPRTTA